MCVGWMIIELVEFDVLRGGDGAVYIEFELRWDF